MKPNKSCENYLGLYQENKEVAGKLYSGKTLSQFLSCDAKSENT